MSHNKEKRIRITEAEKEFYWPCIPKSEAKFNKIRADENLFDLSGKTFSGRSLDAICVL